MTDKYRRIILFLILVVVVVIIVDLVFNFRGIFMENYERYVKSQENFIDKSTEDIVKSVISKVSGKIINVDYQSSQDGIQRCRMLFGGQSTSVQVLRQRCLQISPSNREGSSCPQKRMELESLITPFRTVIRLYWR